MPEKWKTPRVDAKGVHAPDPGGKCPHCPPADPALAARRMDVVERATRGLTGKDVVAALEALARLTDIGPVCGVCGGTGFVRVCRACDGHACTTKTLIKDHAVEVYVEMEEYDEEPEISTVVEGPKGEMLHAVLRKAKKGKREITKTRPVMREAWLNGPPCPTCKGTGQEAIAAAEVGSG